MTSFLKKIIPIKLFKKIQPIYHYCLSYLANIFYGFPADKLIVIGVTGTAGKTSVVYLIVRALEEAGWPTGYSSTTQFSDGQREWLNDKKMTMPGRFFLPKLLKRMVKNGCRFAVIETTSQGIEQFRHRFINYDTVVVTGLYSEHIEAHGSFENYKRAKGKLCSHLKKYPQKYINEGRQVVKAKGRLNKLELNRVKKTLIVNASDEHGLYFLSFPADNKIALVKTEEEKNNLLKENENFQIFKLENVKTNSSGTSFSLENTSFDLKIYGDFQAENASLAALSAHSYGADFNQIKEGLEKVGSLAGKMEKINIGQDFMVIVDYAYEPVALEKLYKLLSILNYNRIIHVLGSAGGGRDQARRPKLGKIAGKNADLVIVSNEDPYDEDPQLIIDQVASGVSLEAKEEKKNLFKILDRREAISFALKQAKKDDLVLITGKGAEQFICLKDNKKIDWDDRRVVRQELEKICG